MLGWSASLWSFTRYTASQVFAGKFAWFLLLALVMFCTLVVVNAVQEEVPPNAAAVFHFLLVPGLLLTFYPSAYTLQSDVDARMLETFFGIPDYRFKVWLARHLVQQLAIASILLGLAALCDLALAELPTWALVFHVMFPIAFLSSIGFMLATLLRSGNGTAAVLLIVGFGCWILEEVVGGTRWSIYLNPFERSSADYLAYGTEVYYSRAYLLVGLGVAILLALLRLRRRECFV